MKIYIILSIVVIQLFSYNIFCQKVASQDVDGFEDTCCNSSKDGSANSSGCCGTEGVKKETYWLLYKKTEIVGCGLDDPGVWTLSSNDTLKLCDDQEPEDIENDVTEGTVSDYEDDSDDDGEDDTFGQSIGDSFGGPTDCTYITTVYSEYRKVGEKSCCEASTTQTTTSFSQDYDLDGLASLISAMPLVKKFSYSANFTTSRTESEECCGEDSKKEVVKLTEDETIGSFTASMSMEIPAWGFSWSSKIKGIYSVEIFVGIAPEIGVSLSPSLSVKYKKYSPVIEPCKNCKETSVSISLTISLGLRGGIEVEITAFLFSTSVAAVVGASVTGSATISYSQSECPEPSKPEFKMCGGKLKGKVYATFSFLGWSYEKWKETTFFNGWGGC